MPRDIDEKKTRKALRKLRKARDRAESEGGPGLTEWEQEFVEGVEERLNTYGSAFSDPEKGALDEALSARQSQIVKQIDKKARGKGMKRSSFKSKTPQRSSGALFSSVLLVCASVPWESRLRIRWRRRRTCACALRTPRGGS